MVARASLSLFSPLFFINKPFSRDGWLNTGANILLFSKFKIFLSLIEKKCKMNLFTYNFAELN
jgi:hypothetical protein